MNKNVQKLCLYASLSFLVACGSDSNKKNDPIERGIDLKAMDTSGRPQDDG